MLPSTEAAKPEQIEVVNFWLSSNLRVTTRIVLPGLSLSMVRRRKFWFNVRPLASLPSTKSDCCSQWRDKFDLQIACGSRHTVAEVDTAAPDRELSQRTLLLHD